MFDEIKTYGLISNISMTKRIHIACGWQVDLPFKSPLQAIPNNTWHERIFVFLALERRFMLKNASL